MMGSTVPQHHMMAQQGLSSFVVARKSARHCTCLGEVKQVSQNNYLGLLVMPSHASAAKLLHLVAVQVSS